MTLDEIQEIIDSRGLDSILADNYIELPFALSVLDDLGYINLEQYLDGEDDQT